MTKKLQDGDSFFKKQIKFFEEVYDLSDENDERYRTFFAEYLNTGKKEFEHKVTFLGEETLTKPDILWILYSITYREKIPASILEFTKSPSQSNFNDVLNSYYYDSLLQILAYKESKLVPGILVKDTALSFIFCSIYFPDDLHLLSKQLIPQLNDYFDQEKEYPNIRDEDFGRDNTIYLAAHLAAYFELKEISDMLFDFCKKDIQTDYFNAIRDFNFLKENLEAKWIEGMADFHIKNSKRDLTLPFNHEVWQYFPIEILALLVFRQRKGLFNADTEGNEMVKIFVPYIYEKEILLDEETIRLRNRILNNV
ncbi:hypothetical protein AGMMS49983_21660 [Clostridia bacterium]|nr:hypothetical protein AGMMS49983_21660 [Clostridia bacterium]